MRTLLYRFFIENWPRKLLSLFLAIVIWFIVNDSMTTTKTIHGIPVRVKNLPPEKTVENMQVDGILNKRATLTLTGNKTTMDGLSHKDLIVEIDATGQTEDQWIATITTKNLVSLNKNLDLIKSNVRVANDYDLIIKQSNSITEKIPIHITQPIGEPPKGYQFLDIWPYRTYVTVSGPEEIVKRLKSRGTKLTFSLSDIEKEELDSLPSKQLDEVSYFIPDSLKKVNLPLLSDKPIEIDDPQIKYLKIDLARHALISIGSPIPVIVAFPLKTSATLNPETYTLATNDFIIKKNGIKLIAAPLYATGVTRLFLDIVKDHIQVVIIAAPKTERDQLQWYVQLINSSELENRYIAKVISDALEAGHDASLIQEEMIRNRFRKFEANFRLCTAEDQKLFLKIALQANTITVTPQNL